MFKKKPNFRKPEHIISQSLSMLGSNIFALSLAFILNIIVVNNLTISDYGHYRYATNYLLFLSTLLFFGFQYSIGRLLALTDEKSQIERLLGGSLFIIFILSVIGAGFTIVAVFLIRSLTIYSLDPILYATSPYVFANLIVILLQNVLQGMNKIHLYSLTNVVTITCVIIVSAICIGLFKNYNLYLALNIYYISYIVIGLAVLRKLGFSFKDLKKVLKLIRYENKKNGFQIYIGSLSGVAINQFLVVLLGSLTTVEQYGGFTLAISISAPLTMIAGSLGAVMYKSNVKRKSISPRVLIALIIICGGSLLVYIFCIKHIVLLLFGDKYLDVVSMSQALAFASIIMGIGDFFNRYIGAKGHGALLRNGALITGATSLVVFVALIGPYGTWGVIFSRIASSIAYTSTMVLYYSRIIERKSVEL